MHGTRIGESNLLQLFKYLYDVLTNILDQGASHM